MTGIAFWFYKNKQIRNLVENLDDKQAIINSLTSHVQDKEILIGELKNDIQKLVSKNGDKSAKQAATAEPTDKGKKPKIQGVTRQSTPPATTQTKGQTGRNYRRKKTTNTNVSN